MAGRELIRDKSEAKPNKKRAPSDVAKRALAEADARKAKALVKPVAGETGGPKGVEPTRYGDWERKGIVSDF